MVQGLMRPLFLRVAVFRLSMHISVIQDVCQNFIFYRRKKCCDLFFFFNMKGFEKGLIKVIALCFLFNMLESKGNSSYELRGPLPPILSLAEQLLVGF